MRPLSAISPAPYFHFKKSFAVVSTIIDTLYPVSKRILAARCQGKPGGLARSFHRAADQTTINGVQLRIAELDLVFSAPSEAMVLVILLNTCSRLNNSTVLGLTLTAHADCLSRGFRYVHALVW